jgi:hypothetical protein
MHDASRTPTHFSFLGNEKDFFLFAFSAQSINELVLPPYQIIRQLDHGKEN